MEMWEPSHGHIRAEQLHTFTHHCILHASWAAYTCLYIRNVNNTVMFFSLQEPQVLLQVLTSSHTSSSPVLQSPPVCVMVVTVVVVTPRPGWVSTGSSALSLNGVHRSARVPRRSRPPSTKSSILSPDFSRGSCCMIQINTEVEKTHFRHKRWFLICPNPNADSVPGEFFTFVTGTC